MFKFKSEKPYWHEFSSYQSFQSVDEMIEQIKLFESTYDLTPAAKAVLNTIKLYSKRFIGVCWLKREEIARKAGVSLSTVKRTLTSLKQTGFITIHEQNHTKRGGQTHNVYVINSIFEPAEEPANEPPSEDFPEALSLSIASDSDDQHQTHKNYDTNSNKTLNNLSIGKFDILKNIPNEFIDLMEPFYANNPEIIRDRWKTVCVAVKKSCFSLSYTSFNTIRQAWTDVVKFYKRGKIKDSSEDGLGGYFYGVLCDYLTNDWIRSQFA